MEKSVLGKDKCVVGEQKKTERKKVSQSSEGKK